MYHVENIAKLLSIYLLWFLFNANGWIVNSIRVFRSFVIILDLEVPDFKISCHSYYRRQNLVLENPKYCKDRSTLIEQSINGLLYIYTNHTKSSKNRSNIDIDTTISLKFSLYRYRFISTARYY